MIDEVNGAEATKLEDKGSIQVKGKNENTTSSKPVALTHNSGLSAVNLFNPNELAAAENYLKRILRTEKGGIKTVEEGLAIMMRAQDLSLPFSTCIEHVHVINGKTGVDIHVVKALLLRAGCTWKPLKDYQPLYEYTDGINVYIDGSFPDYVERCTSFAEAEEKTKAAGDKHDKVYIYPVKWYKDFNGNSYRDYQLSTAKFTVVVNRNQADAVIKAGKIPVYRVPNIPVDFVTEYEITRTINGTVMKAIGRFSYSEAVAADMFNKDTYKKYPRILIGHRAFTYAARDIASDVLFGVMETTELKVINNVDLDNSDIIDITDVEEIN